MCVWSVESSPSYNWQQNCKFFCMYYFQFSFLCIWSIFSIQLSFIFIVENALTRKLQVLLIFFKGDFLKVPAILIKHLLFQLAEYKLEWTMNNNVLTLFSVKAAMQQLFMLYQCKMQFLLHFHVPFWLVDLFYLCPNFLPS